MKQHSILGAQILEGSDAESIKLAEIIALTHHEKWDGSGYPKGLRGSEIPLVGRITAIADVFDALTSKRPYKEPFPLEKAYSEIKGQEERLKASLKRLKEQYRWGHISQREYLKNYTETEYQLKQLTLGKNGQEELERLVHFLANVADGWREANQKQRNKLARVLFEEIRLDSGGKVVAVKPRPELEPFFRLSYECHARDIGCDPGGIRTPDLHRDRVAC